MNNLRFLKEPIPITEQVWDENTIPLVSIGCITYNHESYIRDTIEGFLMQKTTFPIEIAVFEDCSTDKTASIIKEYQEKYPTLFKVFNQPINTWGKSIRNEAKGIYYKERNRAKYFANCEGDDYWTDSLKLQKQVDFLESNPDYVLCFHDCRLMKEGVLEERFLEKYNFQEDREITAEEFQNWWAQTATIVYRHHQKIHQKMSLVKTIMYGDVIFYLAAVEFGRIHFINEVMSVYRKHPGGATQIDNGNQKDFKKIKQYKEMEKVFNRSLSKPITKFYYVIARRYFIKKEYWLFIKHLGLAISHNPLEALKRVKTDFINKI